MSSKITGRRSSILSLLTALVTPLALLIAFMAALSYTSLVNAAGSITVEIIAGYNLVVDSNVEAPSTAAPSVATVIGRVCNTSTVTLNNVSVSIGDYANNTPGIYPVRLASDLTGPLYNTVGSYSFTHIGGTADATRLIPTLAPGECKVEYWHFTYPRCENNPDGTPASPPCDYGATWGDSIKPDDDLWLTFDVWATESDGSVATDTWKMTMRNEIAAMANKVEPNPLGQWFNTESNTVEAGGLITTNGILYELGVINKGFDNDGDLIYDYNAWLQPIGDPSFDPTCFRLMRTTGVLTVSRGAGQRDAIIPFTDTLYFTNLPPDNTGVRGLVFYTFMAIRGSCATSVSPYQEVASGADNEKFNGDYGVAPPPPSTTPPEVSLDKTGNITVTAGSQITYTVSLSNAGPNSAGMPSVGMPLVLSDTMPVSTTFITNSTTTSVTILYSTDHGQTYTTTPPVPASTVTNVQWWLTSPLTAGASIAFTFSVEVDSVFPPAGADPYINNCADVSFGGATPFDEDCAPTLVAGSYSIGDRVWRDENLDRLQTTGELSISNISLYLYYDKNGDRVLDSGDPQIMTTTTSVTGWYNFAGLISGTYIVKVNGSDPDLPTGYRNTTPITYATQLSSTHTSDLAADFGFGPSLTVAKTASYDGQYVRYSIPIANQRPGGGTPVAGGCQYEVWVNGYDASRSGTGNKAFLNPQNAYSPPGPDRLYATAPYGNAGEQLALWGFNLGLAKPGNIVKVEVLLPVVKYGNFASTAVFHAAVMTSATTLQSHSSHIFYPADLTSGTWITDVTADRASWDWSLFNGNTLGCFLESYRGTGATDGHIDLDAAGYRITSDAPCVAGDPDDAITSVPLTDTYTYDTSLLQFVSASPPQSGINTTAGVITWTNVGPIDPGQTANIQVTFRALPRTSSFLITNTACVSGATFSDGQPVNDACGSVTNLFTPTGIISGVVWARNGTATDWYDSTGYYSTDWRIPNVTVMLYECVWDDGSGAVYGTDVSPNKDCTAQSKAGGAKGIITPTDIAVTDQSGAYTFTGLLNGFYYVGIDTASLPAGYSEAADPGNQGNGTGSWCLGTPGTCDNRWITDSVWLRIADLNPIGDGSGSASDSYSEVISNVNFGYTNTLAAIYGTIWEDHDRDGSRDAGDQGLDTGTAGITVTLRNLAGTPVYTTQTNASGYYLFTNVTPGTYTITVVSSTLPPGGTWTQTYDPDALCVPTKQSGCDDAHTVVNLLAGQISGSHDFGYYRGGEYSIGDTVYTDWNGNGTQDSGEEGLAGITVTLYADSNANGVYDLAQDALITSTTTSAAGTYLFTGLVTGTYFVVADTSGLPSWWDDYRETQDPDEGGVCTSCNSRGTAVVSSAHTSELDMDFGYQPVGFSTIGDYVWHDANRDGFQGATETGISGVVVQLYEDGNGNGFIDPEDALVMTKTTNSAGYYLFDSLLTHLQSMTGTHGEYLVQVVTSTVITDVYGNPYVLTTQSNPISVSLSTGQNYLDADFGFAAGGRIGDRIWQDNNGNGNQDLGEPGISGVTVTLYIAGNDIPYLTATTSLTGFYCFNSLPAGNYVVVVDTSTLVGLTQTGDPDIGQFNPCRNPITGEPMACDSQSSLHLAVGQEDLSRDFGYQPALYIGDRVWLDTNNYGVQDNVSGNTDPGSVSEIYTEPGIAGVVITLTNQSGGVVTTTTDSDGRYSFGGLAPNSTYTVTVSAGTLPAGVQPTWEYSTTTSPGGQVTVTTGVTSVTSIGGLDCTNCNMAVDFGYAYATGSYSISGTAYHDDVTTDGYLYKPYTTEDSPMTCTVLIYLWMDTGGGDFTQIDSTWTTLSTGLYTFTNLAAGNYRVSTSPVAPNGMVNTTGNIRTPLAEAPIVLSSTHTSSVDNDFGFAGPGYPTAIELASFTARNRAGASPLVEWVTAMELHNLGFNLYRTDSPNKLPGREQRLNDSLIPSQSPGSLMGAAYAYADEMAVAGVIYYYWLEAIDNKGVADLYGPVSTADSVDTTTPSASSPIYLPIVIKPGQ
jgi:uncharacterized repeat protein (TIGR01451 family)